MTPLLLFILTVPPPESTNWILELRSGPRICHGTPVGIIHILTAEHCVADQETGKVTDDDVQWKGQGQVGLARVQWTDGKRDLAMLHTTPQSWRIVTIAKRRPEPLEGVYWRSFLPRHVSVVTWGRYLGVDDDGDADVAPLFNAPGGSGSALLNSKGELVGVMKQVFNPYTVKHRVATIEEAIDALSSAVRFTPVAVAEPVNEWPKP